jgi:zinc protease
VGVNLWYHVGSKNERPGRTGFAHLFEHVMFEGSAHVPGGEFDNLLERVGGVNNGSTSNDRTNYWENLPANALELALWLESDRMGFLLDTMTQEKLDVQRDVVKNERRESVENQPYGEAFEAVYEHLYPALHPYHWPVIGSMDDLSAATLDDVRDFFRTYYAPNNASLAVAGDVDVDRVHTLAERYFGSIPAGPPVPEIQTPEVLARTAALSADRRVVVEDDVRLPRIYLAWHAPRAYTDDDAVMDVLSSVLSDGKSSRLFKRLVYDDRIAQEVSAFQNGQELAGSFWIVATARPGVALPQLEEAIDEELRRLMRGGVEAVERERAVNGVETSFTRSLERVGGFGGKADRLNEYYFSTGTAAWARQDLARYRAVTVEAMAEAVGRFLVDRPSVRLAVVPRGAVAPAAPDSAEVGLR